ncbi:MAG: hypothetical protein DRI90_15755 [Deltaproteobacteria bacterium]|nr:MAG: hypothetical protein DRI90_15755 [Deltaproteobacteria bacterium]
MASLPKVKVLKKPPPMMTLLALSAAMACADCRPSSLLRLAQRTLPSGSSLATTTTAYVELDNEHVTVTCADNRACV